MHTLLMWSVLIAITAVVTAVPVVENEGNRSILYWLLVPSLLFGAAALI
jgi:hypothetical protein